MAIKKMTSNDKIIADFCEALMRMDRDEQRRAYASIYYEIGPIDDLMEKGWPNAVQEDYKRHFARLRREIWGE